MSYQTDLWDVSKVVFLGLDALQYVTMNSEQWRLKKANACHSLMVMKSRLSHRWSMDCLIFKGRYHICSLALNIEMIWSHTQCTMPAITMQAGILLMTCFLPVSGNVRRGRVLTPLQMRPSVGRQNFCRRKTTISAMHCFCFSLSLFFFYPLSRDSFYTFFSWYLYELYAGTEILLQLKIYSSVQGKECPTSAYHSTTIHIQTFLQFSKIFHIVRKHAMGTKFGINTAHW